MYLSGVRTIHTKMHRAMVDLIKEERKARGLSQAEVARRLGEYQSWMMRLESGDRRVDIVEFHRVAKAIGFDPVRAVRKIWSS